MNTFVVVADAQKASDTLFRAASGAYQSFGKTIDEAIDSLFRQSGGNDPAALILLHRKAENWDAASGQHRRLQELTSRRNSLGPNEQTELRHLIDNILEQTIVFKRSYI